MILGLEFLNTGGRITYFIINLTLATPIMTGCWIQEPAPPNTHTHRHEIHSFFIAYTCSWFLLSQAPHWYFHLFLQFKLDYLSFHHKAKGVLLSITLHLSLSFSISMSSSLPLHLSLWERKAVGARVFARWCC